MLVFFPSISTLPLGISLRLHKVGWSLGPGLLGGGVRRMKSTRLWAPRANVDQILRLPRACCPLSGVFGCL